MTESQPKWPADDDPERWKNLSNEQISGALFVLKIMLSAGCVRGDALHLVNGLARGIEAEIGRREAGETK